MGPHPTPLGESRKGVPAPSAPWTSAGHREAGRAGTWGGSDLVLEASWEVAHEEVGLVALHLTVLHRPLPQQGVEVHGQHGAGPLLIPGRLLACDGWGGRQGP